MDATPAKEQEPVCTHLTKRRTRYSIRRKIPVDLQSHYGRTEIIKALGTSDRREAEQLCRAEGARLDEEFANVRAALAAPSAPTVAPAPARHSPTNAPALSAQTPRIKKGPRPRLGPNSRERTNYFQTMRHELRTFGRQLIATLSTRPSPMRPLRIHQHRRATRLLMPMKWLCGALHCFACAAMKLPSRGRASLPSSSRSSAWAWKYTMPCSTATWNLRPAFPCLHMKGIGMVFGPS